MGLLYGSPKTRPLFDRFHAFKRSQLFGQVQVGSQPGDGVYHDDAKHRQSRRGYARGFYLGAASGISIGAVILLIRMQYLLTHPEARKKAKIQEQEVFTSWPASSGGTARVR